MRTWPALQIVARCLPLNVLMVLVSASSSAHGQTAPPVTAQAQAAAKRLWSGILLKCGDAKTGDSYYYDRTNDNGHPFYDRQGTIEYRDASFHVYPLPVSRADQLNGIQWHGAAIMAALAYRNCCSGDYNEGVAFAKNKALGYDVEQRGHDRDYLSPGWFVVRMTLGGGQWSFDGNWSRSFDEIAKGPKAACSGIPGTPESAAAQREFEKQQEKEQKEQAEIDRKQAEEADIKKKELAEKARLAEEATARVRAATAELERKRQAAGYWIAPDTGLMWMPKDSEVGLTKTQAGDYCKDSRLGEHSDWRLPTGEELKRLIDPSMSHLIHLSSTVSGDYHVCCGIALTRGVVWTGSTSAQVEVGISPVGRGGGRGARVSGSTVFNFFRGVEMGGPEQMFGGPTWPAICVRVSTADK